MKNKLIRLACFLTTQLAALKRRLASAAVAFRPSSIPFRSWGLLGALLVGLGSFLCARTTHAQSPAASGTVITIAGTGTSGPIGDGGPATNATFQFPNGLAIGSDGTLYVSDSDNLLIRAIAPATGLITTVAGNGSSGDTGNNGQATNAPIGFIIGLAVDRARHVLYLPEWLSDWVRQVNLTNGIISSFAGTGPSNPFPGLGQRGDGGPATGAWLSNVPMDVAVDGAGNVYIAEGCRIRKVDIATGIIHTIAGKSDPHTGGMSDICLSAGDGGPASEATFGYPYSLAVDGAGNVFVVDIAGQSFTSTNLVRRIDAVTGIITRIAGGGTNVPGTGPATNMNLGEISDLVVSDSGQLFLATVNQVFQMDLATGQLTPFAGGTNAAFSGDGGPALAARFNSITGLTLAPGGGLVISDSFNQRIRYVVPDSINLTNDSGQTAFSLPWVNALAGDLTIVNNPNLTNVNAGALASVGGSVEISGNTSADAINVGALTTVSGNLAITDNTSANAINAGMLVSVAGALDIHGNISAGELDLNALISAGSLAITDNTSAGAINVGALTTVSGSLTITDNASADPINASSLVTVAGALDIHGNISAGELDLHALDAAGSLTITDNASTDAINVGSLTTVSGDVTIASNAPNAHVNLGSLTHFGCGSNDVTMTLEGGTFALTNGLTLCTNATLAGSSTVDGSVTNNGTIEPGASPGRINITGQLVLGSSSALRLEIAGTAPGQFDFINVAGSVTLGGTLAVSLIHNFPSVMTNGAGFTLLTAGSPFTGAFANVASGGTLTTTDGYARFTVRYADETTVRLTGLVIVDTDTDGLPDWWEDQFSLNKTNAADAVLDLDGDGAANAAEFLAGTIPTNAASVFRIVSVQRESNSVRLTWSVVGGKSYHVQTNGSVTDPFADLTPLITVPGTGEATTSLMDSGAATNAAARYYRVRLGP